MLLPDALRNGVVYGAPPPFKASTQTTSGNSITLATPSNVPGDMLVAIISADNGTRTLVPPAGWTSLTSMGSQFFIYWRVAGASEPVSSVWSVTPGTSATMSGVALSYGQSSAINVFGTASASSTNGTCPSVTTTVKGCALLVISVDDSSSSSVTASTPATTPRVSYNGNTGITIVRDRPASVKGPTGTTALTFNSRTGFNAYVAHVALRAG